MADAAASTVQFSCDKNGCADVIVDGVVKYHRINNINVAGWSAYKQITNRFRTISESNGRWTNYGPDMPGHTWWHT